MTLEEYLTDLRWDFRQIGNLQSAMELNKTTPAQEMRRQSLLSEKQLLDLFEAVYKCKCISLSQVIFDRDAVLRFGARTCVDKQVIFGTYEGATVAVIADPSDSELIQRLHEDDSLQIYTASIEDLADIISISVQPLILSQISNTINIQTENLFKTVDLATVGDSAISDLIKQIVKTAYAVHASDIQIIPMSVTAEIYFRVDGVRMLITQIDKSAIAPLHRVLGTLAKQQTEDERRILEGKFSFTIDNTEIEIRLNIIPTRNGASINLRLLPQDNKTIAEISSSERIQQILSSIVEMSEGLILFCGPTGSGKSTSMITLAKRLLQKNINICSIEDPVEQVVAGINQVDFSEAKDLTYATVTKAFLRHDPDVIIIGEIRNKDVADVALQAADTGHLILSTLHTKDAVTTINRLVNLGVNRAALAENLSIIVAQRLVRKVCPNCSRKIKLGTDDKRREIFNLGTADIECREAVGCMECNHTGYKGRLCLCEILVIDEKLRTLIMNGASLDEFRSILEAQNHEGILADGISHVLRGETTFEELVPIIINTQVKKGDLTGVKW